MWFFRNMESSSMVTCMLSLVLGETEDRNDVQ
jgi:hypothetical protein